MSGSTVDAALAGLVALWSSVDATVTVIDGQPFDPTGPRFLCVGWDESGHPAVTGSKNPADLTSAVDVDVYLVSSLLTYWAGNEPPQTLRGDMFTYFDALDTRLFTNRTLSGAVARAAVTGYEYSTDTRPEGALAQLRFTTRIQAWK